MKFYDDYYNDLLCITNGMLNSDINTHLDYRDIANNQYNKISHLKNKFNKYNSSIIFQKIDNVKDDIEYSHYYASLLIIYNSYQTNPIKVDLHGLFVFEANTIVHCLLEIWKEKKVKSATIITGNLKKNGLHSLVKNILINKKLKYKMINSGSFFILIN